MIRILLIRHGTTELLGRVLYGRAANVSLSKAGVEEANRLAASLSQRVKLDEVITSPMQRALQTAEPVAKLQNIPVTLDDGFLEIDFGTWTGRTFSELHTIDEWKHYNRVRSLARPPGGESTLEVQVRAWKSIQSQIAKHSNQDAKIAVVTHGDVIRGLLMLFLGMPVDHIHRFEISPASVSEVIVDGGHARVLSMNETLWTQVALFNSPL